MPEAFAAIPATRFIGTAAEIGTYTGAVSLSATQDQGFWGSPVRISPGFAVDQPVEVRGLIQNEFTNSTPGLFINFVVGLDVWRPPATLTSLSAIFDFPVPNPWAINDFALFLVDAGSGFTFPANTFAIGDIAAFRFRRNGVAATDTWPNLMKLALSLHLRYCITSGAGSLCCLL
jgi:hypothetical protein